MGSQKIVELMSGAPIIKANSLSGDYRALAEFGNVVLAGHLTRYGVEFVTWEWVQDHTSLWQGHYYGEDFTRAKEDFIIRSGLLSQERLFTVQQLAEVYRCIHETLKGDYSMTGEREKLLKGIIEQIEEAVPSLDDLVHRSNQQEHEVGFFLTGLNMTQEF